jgi:PAS domain S-box-containing protein
MKTQHTSLPFTIIKQIPHSLVLVFDKDFRYIFAEGEAFVENGMNPEFFVGKTIHESFPAEEVVFFIPYYQSVIRGEKKQYEHVHLGQTFLHNFFPYYNDYQELVGGIVISQNITDFKIVQTQLMQSEQRYDLAMKSAHTGIYDWSGTTENTYRSPRVWEIFEIDESEFSTSPSTFLQYIHPEDFKILKNVFSNDLTMDVFSYEIRIITGKNNLKWIQSSGMILRNESGEVVRIVGSILDITSRKEIEAALVESEEKFRELISWLPINVALYDKKGEIVYSNNSQENTLVANVNYYNEDGSIIPANQHPAMLVLATGFAQKDIIMGRQDPSNGRNVWHNVNAIAIKKNGLVDKVICTFTDITALKQTREEALETSKILVVQNKQLEEFAHITSHNLRAPISNLSLLVSLHKQARSEQEKDVYVSKIAEVSEHLLHSIDVLAHSLKIKNEIHKDRELVQFKEILAQTKQVLSGQIASSRAQITHRFDVAELLYPRVYLESILQNLASNAIKYRDRRRVLHLSISTYKENGRTVLEIDDNGIGINLDRHGNKIFGLYKTFHANKDARGVGLFLVKNQVEAMGGFIEVESKEGTGTKFKITF